MALVWRLCIGLLVVPTIWCQTTLPTSAPPPAQTTLPTSAPPPAQTTLPTSAPPPAQTTLPTSAPPPAQTTLPTSAPPPAQTTLPTSAPPPAPTALPLAAFAPKNPQLTPDQLLQPTLRPPGPNPPCGRFWTFWSEWSECSKTCGQGGLQSRHRSCRSVAWPCRPYFYNNLSPFNRPQASTPWHGLKHPVNPQPAPGAPPSTPWICPLLPWYYYGCTGPRVQYRACFKGPCCKDRDGGWGEWGCWSVCQRGTRIRKRACNNPKPQGFGKLCPGTLFGANENIACCIDGTDIIFSIDGSGSVGPSTFASVRYAMKVAISMMDLDTGVPPSSEKVRVGIQVFNDKPNPVKNLNDFYLPFYTYPGGGTDIAAAVTHVDKVMLGNPAKGDRPDVGGHSLGHSNTVVLITDGWGITALPPVSNIDRLIVIGVGNNINPAMVNWPRDIGDFLHATSTCQILPFLQRRLLCQGTILDLTSARCGPLRPFQTYSVRQLSNTTIL